MERGHAACLRGQEAPGRASQSADGGAEHAHRPARRLVQSGPCGHRQISLAALKRLGLDQVWWLVSPGNPLKEPKRRTLATRMAAAREIAHHPKIVVTGFEAGRASAYTIDTLRFLKRRFPPSISCG